MKHHSPVGRYLSRSCPRWSSQFRRPIFSVPGEWRHSLADNTSLTARLVDAAEGDFCVQVLWQGWRHLTSVERDALGISSARCTAWTRDVALKVKGEPWVYARTCIPASTLTGPERRLMNLGNRSLGAYLFRHPDMKRGRIDASSMKPNALGIRWARKSVFYLSGKPLLVTEAFVKSPPVS